MARAIELTAWYGCCESLQPWRFGHLQWGRIGSLGWCPASSKPNLRALSEILSLKLGTDKILEEISCDDLLILRFTGHWHRRQYKYLKFLEEYGADIELSNGDWQQVIQLAAMNGDLPVEAHLWPRGHSLNRQDLNAKDACRDGFSHANYAMGMFVLGNFGPDLPCGENSSCLGRPGKSLYQASLFIKQLHILRRQSFSRSC